MLVSELIEILKTMPQDVIVEVNDNQGGEVYSIEQVDFFGKEEYLNSEDVVMIQVNV